MQVASLQAQLAQMSKEIEVLTEKNAALLQCVPKESNMNPENKEEEHSSRCNGRKDTKENPKKENDSWEKQSRKANRHKGKSGKRKLRDAVAALEEKCNLIR